MHHTAKVVRTVPHFDWEELKSVTLQLKIERTWSRDVSEMLFSQSISGSVFFCGQDDIYRHLQDFEGNLIDPPLAGSVTPMFNFEVDLPIPEYIHDVWKGGDWHLRLKVLLGSLGLEFESEIYDAPTITWGHGQATSCWSDQDSQNNYGFVPTPGRTTETNGEASEQQEDSQATWLDRISENNYGYAPTPGGTPESYGDASDQQEEDQEDESKPSEEDLAEQTIIPDQSFEQFKEEWDRTKCEEQDRLMGLFWRTNTVDFENAMQQ